MVITYYGHEFFKVQFGDTVVAVNPISKESKLKQSRFGADMVLISAENDPDRNGIEMVMHGDKKPFVIAGPGEYEVDGVFVKGARLEPSSEHGSATTIYWLLLEGMRLCFLSGLSGKQLSQEIRECIGEVDILFIPIGGGPVLSARDAHAVAVALEPHLTIPMHFSTGETGAESALAQFLKESGVEDAKPLDKLTLKKKEVLESNGTVMILLAN